MPLSSIPGTPHPVIISCLVLYWKKKTPTPDIDILMIIIHSSVHYFSGTSSVNDAGEHKDESSSLSCTRMYSPADPGQQPCGQAGRSTHHRREITKRLRGPLASGEELTMPKDAVSITAFHRNFMRNKSHFLHGIL